MDPLSITAAATAIATNSLKVAHSLYGFIDDVRNANGDLQSLHDEVISMSRVSKAIKDTWAKDGHIVTARAAEDGELWASVEASLKDCDVVVKKLGSELGQVQTGGFMDRILSKRPARAIKLKMKEKDINLWRNQIHSHTSSLQSGLIMITVCTQLRGQGVHHSMVGDLAALDQNRQDLERSLQPGGAYDLTKPHSKADQDIVHNFRRLAGEIKSFHSNRSTTLTSSRSTVWDGSVIGEPLSSEREESIRNWIPQTGEEHSPEENGKIQHLRVDETKQTTNKRPVSPVSPARKQVLVKQFMVLGLQNLQTGHFAKAEGFYRKCIAYGIDDPTLNIDYSKAKIALAHSFAMQGKWEDLRDLLASSRDVSSEHEIFRLDLLILQNAAMGLTEAAIGYAEQSYDLKIERFGKSAPSTCWTLRRLAGLLEAEGKAEEAEAYMSFVPSGNKVPPTKGSPAQEFLEFVVELIENRHGLPPGWEERMMHDGRVYFVTITLDKRPGWTLAEFSIGPHLKRWLPLPET